jgi:uncharacterized protein YjbI with pentapeptide repeats
VKQATKDKQIHVLKTNKQLWNRYIVMFFRRLYLMANLSGCDLSGCDLRGCNLSGCNLRGCNLSGCDLRGCNLRGCNLLVYKTETWTCYIQKGCIRIGCHSHKLEEWMSFDDTTIDNFDRKAVAWAKRHKEAIIAIHSILEKD